MLLHIAAAAVYCCGGIAGCLTGEWIIQTRPGPAMSVDYTGSPHAAR